MMIEGASLQGEAHKYYSVANQDAFRYGNIKNYTIAIVCDGVSLKLDHQFSQSEIAARFCTNYAYEFLNEKLEADMTMEEITEKLQDCFDETEKALRIFLKSQKIFFWDCQTTLLILVYSQGKCACAMAGDGGAVFQKKDGKCFVIVTREKESPIVEPISVRENWCFSYYDIPGEPIQSFILATDGVFDELVSFSEGRPVINSVLFDQFLDLAKVPQTRRYEDLKKILDKVESSDDKTVIVCVNEKE